MNILFIHYAVIDKQGFGRTFKLAKEIALLKNNVVLITTQSSKEFKFPFKVEHRNNVKIISFPELLPDNFRRTGFAFFSAFFKVIYLIKYHKFDLVHSDTGHRPSAAIPAFFLQYVFKVPHVIEWWDFFGRGGQFDEKSFFKKITFGYYDLIFQKFFLKKSNGVITLSEFLKQKALDIGIPDEKIIVLNGGADVNEIKYYDENESLKTKNNIPTNSLTFGFIGMNSSEFKDLVPFLEANKILKNEINVNWFTTGDYIPEKIKLKYDITNELKEFGWQDYVSFSEIISCADIFLLIQKENVMNEARWPNKIGDYLSSGRLILTNPFGEIKKINLKYPEFFIVTDYHTNSLVEKIKYLYEIKSDLVYKGKLVREIAEKNITWSHIAIELLAFYKKTISTTK